MKDQKEMNIYEKLLKIQVELKAPKGQYNSFGKYKYRSCEDILETLKPLLKKHRITLKISDELVYIGERYYVKAMATLINLDNGESMTNTAYAREEEMKKGMDGSQITGTASSYARKYALNGLFCIDDTKDADTDEYANQNKSAKNDDMTLEEAKNYVLTFGKHKGKLAKDVDQEYFEWLINNGKANATIKQLYRLLFKTSDMTPYDFMSDEEKLKSQPIDEARKQQIKENLTKEEIIQALKKYGKSKISELSLGQALEMLEEKDKELENKLKEEKEIF